MNPYDTEEFGELRARQRQLLRAIAQRYLPRAEELPAIVKGAQQERDHLEAALRSRVAELVDDETAEQMVSVAGRRRLRDFYVREVTIPHHSREQIDGEIDVARRAEFEDPEIDDPTLYRLGLTLAMADAVADDGYSDPRLQEGG